MLYSDVRHPGPESALSALHASNTRKEDVPSYNLVSPFSPQDWLSTSNSLSDSPSPMSNTKVELPFIHCQSRVGDEKRKRIWRRILIYCFPACNRFGGLNVGTRIPGPVYLWIRFYGLFFVLFRWSSQLFLFRVFVLTI